MIVHYASFFDIKSIEKVRGRYIHSINCNIDENGNINTKQESTKKGKKVG